jgi:hypothetical protein
MRLLGRLRNNSRRDDGADAGDLSNATATCVAGSDLFELIGQIFDLLFDGLPL